MPLISVLCLFLLLRLLLNSTLLSYKIQSGDSDGTDASDYNYFRLFC